MQEKKTTEAKVEVIDLFRKDLPEEEISLVEQEPASFIFGCAGMHGSVVE